MDSKKLFARVKNLELVSSKLVEGLFAGNYRSVFKGPGIEFDEVREYVEEDDARLIDWNVSSRMGAPYTKTFREERELTLFFLVDVSASMFSGSEETNKLLTAGIVASLLSFAAVRNNDRVGGIFFSDRIEHWVPPNKGKKHALRLIRDTLNMAPQGRGTDIALALRTVQETMNRRGICFVLSDFRFRLPPQELMLLAKKHDAVALRITDEGDTRFPMAGLVELEDTETEERIHAQGNSKKFRDYYEQFFQDQERIWKKACAKAGVDTLTLSTAEDPGKKLVSFFRRRKKRS